MSSIARIAKFLDQTTADAKASQQLDLIRALVETLPLAHQQQLIDELAQKIRVIPASRAGEVLGQIVRFLPEQKEWTTAEIKDRLEVSGVKLETKRPIFNAIQYLERKNRIERLGNGKYRIGGIGFQTGSESDIDDLIGNQDE